MSAEFQPPTNNPNQHNPWDDFLIDNPSYGLPDGQQAGRPDQALSQQDVWGNNNPFSQPYDGNPWSLTSTEEGPSGTWAVEDLAPTNPRSKVAREFEPGTMSQAKSSGGGWWEGTDWSTPSETVPQTSSSGNEIGPGKTSKKVKIVAGIAAVTAVVGVGGGLAARKYMGGGEDGAVSASQPNHSTENREPKTTVIRPNLQPTSEAAPSTVVVDIQKALAVDTCPVTVTEKSVIQTYKDFFTKKERSDLSPAEISARADAVLKDLAESKTVLKFASLPSNMEQLVAEADTGKVPMSEVESAAKSFFKEFGINAKFDWDMSLQPNIENTPDEDAIAYLNKSARPAKADETKVAGQAKILGAMQGLSTTPVDLLKGAAGLDGIHFGKITTEPAAGLAFQAPNGKNILVFDTTDINKDNSEWEKNYYETDVAPHESSHFLHYAQCLNLNMFGASTLEDESNNVLSQRAGFKYGKELPAGLTTLDSDESGKVVGVNEYALTHSLESTASTMAAVLDPTTRETLLYDEKGRDLTPLWEQAAVAVARLHEVSPRVGEYYSKQFDVTRVLLAAKAAQANASLSSEDAAKLADTVEKLEAAQRS